MISVQVTVIVASVIITTEASHGKQCTYIDYNGKNETEDSLKRNCSSHEVCRGNYTISLIDIPPYDTSHLFERIVEGCCGLPCTHFNIVKIYRNISEVQLSDEWSSDFMLPFLGTSSAVELYGHHFIPFVNVPCAYYISHKLASPMSQMIDNCLDLCPLIIFCLLAAVISGFIVWSIETLSKKSGSQTQPFLHGLFEGFWWSFTIVTSGYGANVISSKIAKLYSVIWILIGVVVFSLMTSLFTAELMTAMQPPSTSLLGSQVGVLKYRDHDGSLVAREGAILRASNGSDFHSDVLALTGMLRKKEIDGILLDKYTLMYTKGYMVHMKNQADHFLRSNSSSVDEINVYKEMNKDVEYFLEDTVYSMKHYQAMHMNSGDKLSYGVLIKKEVDYKFLNSAVRDNRLALETATDSFINEKLPRKFPPKMMGPLYNLRHFGKIFTWTGIIIGCICVIGVSYEFYNHKKKQKVPLIQNSETSIDHLTTKEDRERGTIVTIIKDYSDFP